MGLNIANRSIFTKFTGFINSFFRKIDSLFFSYPQQISNEQKHDLHKPENHASVHPVIIHNSNNEGNDPREANDTGTDINVDSNDQGSLTSSSEFGFDTGFITTNSDSSFVSDFGGFTS